MSMETKEYAEVAAGDCIQLSGSMCKVLIRGDVGEYARVMVNGSMGVIQVAGFIHKGAEVVVNGSMGKIFHNGKHKTALVEARGSMGSVVQQDLISYAPRAPRPPRAPRRPKPPPDRSGLQFGTRFGLSDLFSSSSETITVSNVGKGQSIRVVGDEVWIDGEKVEPKKTTEPDPPVPDEAPGVVSVHKSPRPRDKWGT